MGLKEEAIAERRHAGRPCTLPALLEQLGPEDREDMHDLLRDRGVPISSIRRGLMKLKDAGEFSVSVPSESTLRRHRNEPCGCGIPRKES